MYLSRDVSIVDEDYASYSIGICIEDTSHPLQGQVCGQLDVTFNSKCFVFIVSMILTLPQTVTNFVVCLCC